MTTTTAQTDIPPPRGFDEFQTLSSTKQNIELFKILSAIAEEIEVLRQSTERRFNLIESLVTQQQTKQNFYGLIPTGYSSADNLSLFKIQIIKLCFNKKKLCHISNISSL